VLRSQIKKSKGKAGYKSAEPGKKVVKLTGTELLALIKKGESESIEFKPHLSTLRNKGIGAVFYDIELIEQWGSGIGKTRNACLQAGLPEPQFEERQGLRMIFRKDLYTEEYLRQLGLNERQIKAVMYVKERGKITNKEKREVCSISERTARAFSG